MTMSFFQDEQDSVFYNMGNIYLLLSENLIMRSARALVFIFTTKIYSIHKFICTFIIVILI